MKWHKKVDLHHLYGPSSPITHALQQERNFFLEKTLLD